MRTRKTTRKSITLPGRYFTGLGTPENVTLVDLSVGGCRFANGDRRVTLGSPMQIYVANTGPHRAIVKWVQNGEVGVTFTTPLSQEQFEAFQSSHIPDAAKPEAMAPFEDMVGVKPQRFC